MCRWLRPCSVLPPATRGVTIALLIMTNDVEEIRLRYLYRRLLLSGKVRLSYESARGLVGPDCAYHLYGVVDLKKKLQRGRKP